MVRVRADGSEEVFTRDLVWELSGLRHHTPVRVRPATGPEAQRAIREMVRLMNLCRRRDEGGPYQYYGIFDSERDAVDPRTASQIVRQSRDNGRSSTLNRWDAETWNFRTEDGWTPTEVLRKIDVGSTNQEAVPITPAQFEEIVEWMRQWHRAYGN